MRIFLLISVIFIASCSSTPEIITTKPDIPTLQIYEVPVMKQIEFTHKGKEYCTPDDNYIELINKVAILKALIDSYEKEISAYQIFRDAWYK